MYKNLLPRRPNQSAACQQKLQKTPENAKEFQKESKPKPENNPRSVPTDWLRCPQEGHERPQIASRGYQEETRAAPRRSQDSTKMVIGQPSIVSEGRKMFVGWLKMAPVWSKMNPR
jgi:hypothetical protein